jgi:hypothetical protein
LPEIAECKLGLHFRLLEHLYAFKAKATEALGIRANHVVAFHAHVQLPERNHALEVVAFNAIRTADRFHRFRLGEEYS